MASSSSTNKTADNGSRRSPWLFVVVFIVPAVLAILANQVLFAGVDTPPSDFGSGQMFDAIASRYDMINRVLALRMDVGWRKRMVNIVRERVTDTQQPQLLDVATGTADVALMLATEIPDATIIGVDPSANMLSVGREKVKEASLDTKIDLRLGDARDFVHLDSHSFDGATMAFGIRNVPERDVALCEIHRVLKPNAVFAILEFSEPPPDSGFLSGVARIFIQKVVPVLGGLLSGAPKEYLHLQNSIKDFPSPQEFSQLMESVKCGPEGKEAFRLDEFIQMNFDSVQLYVATKVERE